MFIYWDLNRERFQDGNTACKVDGLSALKGRGRGDHKNYDGKNLPVGMR